MRLAAYFLREGLWLAWDVLRHTIRPAPLGYVWVNLDEAPCGGCGRVHRYWTIGCTGAPNPSLALFPPPPQGQPLDGAGEIPFWRVPPGGVWVTR